MKIFLIFIIFLFSFAIVAQEAKVPCLKKDGTLGVNVFPQYDCKLIKKVVQDPSIKNKQKEKIEEKLAEKLAFKLERGLEEIAILDQYFNQYKTALTEDENVKKDCKLEVISNPCGKKLNAYKFKLLISKLQAKGNSLSEKMQYIYTRSNGVIDLNKNECPLEAPSGYYTLNAQFDEKVASNLQEFLTSNSKGGKDWLEAAYKIYPQLKIIQRSNYSNPKFLKEFEEFMKKYDKTKMPNIKAYVLSFYTNPKNQKDLSKGLAQSCTDIKQNIKNFICEDVSNLEMDEETAVNLFNDEENAEELIEISNAFSCEDDVSKNERITPLDNLYGDFISNTEPQLPKGTVKTKSAVVNFCEKYNCQSPDVKELLSCKNGGPLNVDDLNSLYGCNGNFSNEKCGPDQRQWISYLTSLDPTKQAEESRELAKQIGVEWRGSEKTVSSKKREFSSFTQNFLGVEGTLKAEGRAITSESIAEKLREFNDKNIDPLPQQNREVILANNEGNKAYNMMRQPKQEDIQHHQAQISQPFVPNNFIATKENEEQKQAVIANSLSKFSNAESRGNKRDDKFTVKDNERLNEISRIRSELESVMKSMKGSEAEKLDTITDSNGNYAQTKIASTDSFKNMGREERERLDAYRSNLNDWDARLRARETDLIERDMRGGSRSSSSENGGSSPENRFNKPSQDNDQSAPANQTATNGAQNSPALKLAKGQGGQERAGAEREVAGEKGQLAEGETESAIVAAENLATLEKSGLNRLGLGQKDSFIIKVRLSDRIYDVPVKSFNHKGKAMYVPLFSKENRDLAKLILESPLFNDYRQYQQERLRSQAP